MKLLTLFKPLSLIGHSDEDRCHVSQILVTQVG